MAKKYLTLETVAHRFRWDILEKLKNPDINDENKTILWKNYLYILYKGGKISIKQASMWVYPKKYIK